ncbi:DUF4232 domain-containing protein [Lentzea sp. NPDC004782]|uniref:DUF4232 domain-containing protein n=1 Tax=Lentzea sp. NPDC004782 TaxID=3154458 RepID=UPI0033B93A28
MRRFIGTTLLVIGLIATETVTASAAPLPTCKSVDLGILVAREEGTAGTLYREIKFTMRSPGSCVLRGFPGVSYVDSTGAQVGRAARRDGPTGDLITLTYGTSVSAVAGFTNPGNWDPETCRPQPVWGVRIYPPDEFVPLYIKFPDDVGCAGPVDALSTRAVHRS